MKTIFIDIDGPLAWGTWMDGSVMVENFTNSNKPIQIPYPWVKEDCEALTEIIERTNADLVVSSDWRKFYTLRELRSIFQYYGIQKANIIDTTSHYNPMKKMSSTPEWDRACEIKSWVKAFKPENWIAIDDIQLGTYFKQLTIPKWRHVQVNGEHFAAPMLRDKVEECVEKLQRQSIT